MVPNPILSEILTRFNMIIGTIEQRVEEIHDAAVKKQPPTLKISWADKIQMAVMSSVLTVVLLYGIKLIVK